jgi:hypothetical protein
MVTVYTNGFKVLINSLAEQRQCNGEVHSSISASVGDSPTPRRPPDRFGTRVFPLPHEPRQADHRQLKPLMKRGYPFFRPNRGEPERGRGPGEATTRRFEKDLFASPRPRRLL